MFAYYPSTRKGNFHALDMSANNYFISKLFPIWHNEFSTIKKSPKETPVGKQIDQRNPT